MRRRRGTAIVLREGRVLLVKDQGKSTFSLPGGGANKNEPSLAAAVRELREELGMSAHRAERLFHCDYRSKFNHHKVSLVETAGQPKISSSELAEYRWWDGEDDVLLFPHVNHIITRLARHDSTNPGEISGLVPGMFASLRNKR